MEILPGGTVLEMTGCGACRRQHGRDTKGQNLHCMDIHATSFQVLYRNLFSLSLFLSLAPPVDGNGGSFNKSPMSSPPASPAVRPEKAPVTWPRHMKVLHLKESGNTIQIETDKCHPQVVNTLHTWVGTHTIGLGSRCML